MQRLVVGSFSSHLAGLLAGLPGDVVAQLTETLTQLAGNIAQHGQQVRRLNSNQAITPLGMKKCACLVMFVLPQPH